MKTGKQKVVALISIILSVLLISVSIYTLGKNYILVNRTTVYMLDASCPKSKFNGGQFFSQFYEDYILSYVLSDIKNGIYVDVGANDPDYQSATKYFFLNGWKGINIEPNKDLFKLIQKARPQDINISNAVGEKRGKRVLYIPEKFNGLASFDKKTIGLCKEMDTNLSRMHVNIDTLNDIFDRHKVSHIDLLKIDVEGYEKQVLQGLDLNRFRPLVIVIESVSPINFWGVCTFDPIMTSSGYEFGATDDLNFYYFRKENPELREKFKYIHRCTNEDRLLRGTSCRHKDSCSI